MTPNLKHISEKLDEILERLPAATQEPAGSGASEQLLQDFNAQFGFGIFVVTGEHQRTAFFSKEKAERYLAQQHDPERFRIVVYPKPDGSPRKVGEDGAPEKYERTHSRVWTNAWNAAIEECAKHLREGWSVANKDNGDDVMEVLMEELGGLMLPTPSIVGGPSSVPVGEQKEQK